MTQRRRALTISESQLHHQTQLKALQPQTSRLSAVRGRFMMKVQLKTRPQHNSSQRRCLAQLRTVQAKLSRCDTVSASSSIITAS